MCESQVGHERFQDTVKGERFHQLCRNELKHLQSQRGGFKRRLCYSNIHLSQKNILLIRDFLSIFVQILPVMSEM